MQSSDDSAESSAGSQQSADKRSAEAYSWAEVWAVIGTDGDEMLSVTQTNLAYDAYDVEKPPDRAVEDNELTRVTRQGIDFSGSPIQIHAGYRLVGESKAPGGDST